MAHQINGNSFGYVSGGMADSSVSYAATQQVERVLLLDETISDIQGLTSEVEEIAALAQGIANSVFGMAPELTSTAANGIEPPTAGRADSLRNALAILRSAVFAAHSEVQRLQAL